MMTTSPSDGLSYRRYGWYYDAVSSGRARRGEVEFYVAAALRGGAPVLEPACGAGRILAHIFCAGLPVWGTDATPEMVALAEARLSTLRRAHPRVAQLPYRLLTQPLSALDLPERFGAALLPLDALRLPRSAAELADTLARLHAHLRPGGLLAFDLDLPQAALTGSDWLEAVRHPAGGWTRARVRWCPAGDDVLERTEYETTFDDGRELREESDDRYRQVSATELGAALAAAGFTLQATWRDFLGGAWQAGDGLLVGLATRD